MLREFRRRARLLSSLVLPSFAALVALSLTPHEDACHEASCEDSVAHTAADHALGRPGVPGERPIHCVLCHWTRGLRQAAESLSLAAPTDDVASARLDDDRWAPPHPDATQPPLRGPPCSGQLV